MKKPLNLSHFIATPKPAVQSKEYGGPIAWWEVSTEEDQEGYRTKNLGTYYGHIAEIALSVKDRPLYKFSFRKIEKEIPSVIPSYDPVRAHCNICLVDEGDMSYKKREERVKAFEEWMNTDDIEIKQSGFYQSVFIVLSLHKIVDQ